MTAQDDDVFTKVPTFIGWLGQLARADAFTIDNGPARGSRLIRLINGGGLEIEVLPDRALDIGRVTVDGVPVAWISPVDSISPAFYEPAGTGWLRTFGGGLLATCGLDSFGPPSRDADQTFGAHGRIGTVPARLTRVEADETGVRVAGEVRQTGVFAEHMVLRRTIHSELGSDCFTVEDTVTNLGSDSTPHMILYHMNLGWPLLGPDTVLTLPEGSVTPRDADADKGLPDYTANDLPERAYREQVFAHRPSADGWVAVTVSNPRAPLEFELSFDTRQLPAFFQWKLLGEGHYVLGIEPANTPNIFGRAAARQAGELPMLEPGESVNYKLRIRLRTGRAGEAGAH